MVYLTDVGKILMIFYSIGSTVTIKTSNLPSKQLQLSSLTQNQIVLMV